MTNPRPVNILVLAHWLVAALSIAAGAAQAQSGKIEVSRAWIASLHEWAVPRYQRFAAQSQGLTEAIDEACGAEPSPARAITLQRHWVDLMQSWRQLEALQLGPTLQRRSSRSIDFWPTRPQTIERAASMTADVPVTGEQTDEAMQRWGSATKGLPALEWFLFPTSTQEELPLWRSPALCLYARRVARGVAGEGAALRDAWQAQAQQWASASDAEVQRAVQEALNLMVGSCELLRGKKMQKGVRVHVAGGPESGLNFAFDSVRSAHTQVFLLSHFEALAQLLLGRRSRLAYTGEGPAIGLADMLADQGSDAGKALLPAVQKAHRALRALPSNPQQWTLARTDPAAQALRGLREAIDPPIAQALQVTITFTDADGD